MRSKSNGNQAACFPEVISRNARAVVVIGDCLIFSVRAHFTQVPQPKSLIFPIGNYIAAMPLRGHVGDTRSGKASTRCETEFRRRFDRTLHSQGVSCLLLGVWSRVETIWEVWRAPDANISCFAALLPRRHRHHHHHHLGRPRVRT